MRAARAWHITIIHLRSSPDVTTNETAQGPVYTVHMRGEGRTLLMSASTR